MKGSVCPSVDEERGDERGRDKSINKRDSRRGFFCFFLLDFPCLSTDEGREDEEGREREKICRRERGKKRERKIRRGGDHLFF